MEELLKNLLLEISRANGYGLDEEGVPSNIESIATALSDKLQARGVVIIPPAEKPSKHDLSKCIEAIELWDYNTSSGQLLKSIKQQLYP